MAHQCPMSGLVRSRPLLYARANVEFFGGIHGAVPARMGCLNVLGSRLTYALFWCLVWSSRTPTISPQLLHPEFSGVPDRRLPLIALLHQPSSDASFLLTQLGQPLLRLRVGHRVLQFALSPQARGDPVDEYLYVRAWAAGDFVEDSRVHLDL